MGQTVTIEEALRHALRRRRGDASQADVAAAARALGLPWTQTTVAQIELGRRHLTFGELLLLPLVLAHLGDPEVGGQVVDLADLLTEGAQQLRLAPGVTLPASAVRLLLSDDPKTRGARLTTRLPDPERVGAGEVERKAAKRLRCSPDDVLAAAKMLWGRRLAEERDHRLGDPEAQPQKAGRITRQLVAELEPTIKRRRKKTNG